MRTCPEILSPPSLAEIRRKSRCFFYLFPTCTTIEPIKEPISGIILPNLRKMCTLISGRNNNINNAPNAHERGRIICFNLLPLHYTKLTHELRTFLMYRFLGIHNARNALIQEKLKIVQITFERPRFQNILHFSKEPSYSICFSGQGVLLSILFADMSEKSRVFPLRIFL